MVETASLLEQHTHVSRKRPRLQSQLNGLDGSNGRQSPVLDGPEAQLHAAQMENVHVSTCLEVGET
jgi:hypothetical protein